MGIVVVVQVMQNDSENLLHSSMYFNKLFSYAYRIESVDLGMR